MQDTNEATLTPAMEPIAPPLSRAPIRRRAVGLEAKVRRQKILRYSLLCISAAFMVSALVGDNGLLSSMRARRQYAAAQHELINLRLENQQLLEDMRRLKADPTAIEEEARKNLGLIRAGETLVIVKDSK
ncbi:MAG: septum formation initiator family protein [Acidobacteria bacterium]|nr:MAG: septum formation initiator family protein [Acidobacteriota bacterium]